jgi:hypothetical protein
MSPGSSTLVGLHAGYTNEVHHSVASPGSPTSGPPQAVPNRYPNTGVSCVVQNRGTPPGSHTAILHLCCLPAVANRESNQRVNQRGRIKEVANRGSHTGVQPLGVHHRGSKTASTTTGVRQMAFPQGITNRGSPQGSPTATANTWSLTAVSKRRSHSGVAHWWPTDRGCTPNVSKQGFPTEGTTSLHHRWSPTGGRPQAVNYLGSPTGVSHRGSPARFPN